MKDAYAGGKPLLADEELRQAISQYQVAVRQKRATITAKAAEENKKAGESFLAENAKKKGIVILPGGLLYTIFKAGDGKKPADTDTVECHYRGTLVDISAGAGK